MQSSILDNEKKLKGYIEVVTTASNTFLLYSVVLGMSAKKSMLITEKKYLILPIPLVHVFWALFLQITAIAVYFVHSLTIPLIN